MIIIACQAMQSFNYQLASLLTEAHIASSILFPDDKGP